VFFSVIRKTSLHSLPASHLREIAGIGAPAGLGTLGTLQAPMNTLLQLRAAGLWL